MYIKINNLDYPCRERRVENGTISFLGVTGLTLPIPGTAQLGRNDGFILAEDDTADYHRHVLQGTRLTLTNEPEQPPQPYVPTTEQRLSAVEYLLNSMEQAIAEGVSSVE